MRCALSEATLTEQCGPLLSFSLHRLWSSTRHDRKGDTACTGDDASVVLGLPH